MAISCTPIYNAGVIFPNLQKTSLWNSLSALGKHMETPKGIFYWSARAKKEAEIDGTIGIAQDDDGTISHLKIAQEWAGQKVMERVPKGKIFGYAPIEGLQTLREKWLSKMLEQHPKLKSSATLPVVTNGITHSLALTGRLFLEAGQTLITADKSWENYAHIFTDTQRVKIAPFSLFTGEGMFHIDAVIGACREVASLQNKVVLLLNFPHNQTGFMPTQMDFEELAKRLHALCNEHPKVPFVVLLDDAYEGYVYDESGQKFSPASQLHASLPNLTIIKMDGISKVMLAYGYRVGFVTAFANPIHGKAFSTEELAGISAEFGSKVGGFIRGEISQVNHHGQVLADALMDNWEAVGKERAETIGMLRERWKVMMASLESAYKKFGKKHAWADPCNGGFFAYVNLAKGIDAKELADRLLKEKKVGVVPSGQGVRVAFCGVAKEKIPRLASAVFEIASHF